MALPLGKLTILVGAGIIGSVFAKEGRLPNISDLFSGAVKVASVIKQIGRDDSTKPISKPRNDSLMAQVNSLREELQMLASSRPITIVTASGTGSSRYGIIIVIVVVGSGYVWWKGWKLPDMMFATRRSLSDACTSVAEQLETVYSSIRSTKRHLSSRIDRVDSSLDEVAELTASTHEKVGEIRGNSENVNINVRSVSNAVKTLGKIIYEIEGRQEVTLQGVKYLCDCAQEMENSLLEGRTQASSSTNQITSPKMLLNQLVPGTFWKNPGFYSGDTILSLPSSSEPPSPVTNSPAQLQLPLPAPNATPSSEQRSPGLSAVAEISSSSGISNGVRSPKETASGSSVTSWWGLLSRTRSATNPMIHQSELNRR